jgi:predicted HTH transcriptional regulator
MTATPLQSLLSQIALGEDSTRQFKADVRNAESLASEIAAFANTDGGTIFIGVADDDSTPGLSSHDVTRIKPLISNAASHLPNNLTVEKIRAGNSNIRNPILVSYVAKGLLPYHGLGSGIKRALEKWPTIDFSDDHYGCLFTATVHRKPVEELKLVDKDALKGRIAPIKAPLSALQVQLLDFIQSNPAVSYDELAEMTQKDRTTIMRNIGKLKDAGILRRVGSKKTGHWEVTE